MSQSNGGHPQRGNLLGELSLIAVRAILANPMRSVLTLVGVIVGVASVVVVGAGIEGGEKYLVDSVSTALGSDSFILDRLPRFGNVSLADFQRANRRNPRLEISDLEFIRQRCPDCSELAGQVSTTRPVYWKNREIFGTTINGVTANMIFFSTVEVAEGRFFTASETRQSTLGAVIGQDLVEELFQGIDPIGKTIKINTVPLKIMGVLKERGSSFGSSLDNLIYMPITTFNKTFGSRRSIQIRGHAVSRERFDAAVDQARVAMRIRHRLGPGEEDDFGITSTEEINESVQEFGSAVQMVVIPITAVALVVAGIVVMNIMLVSVTERTFEVGLRKSLGARRSDILYQFFLEALFISLAGGLVGLGLAAGVAWLVEATTPIPMRISAGYVGLALGASGGVGLFFGIIPAYLASNKDPILALSAER